MNEPLYSALGEEDPRKDIELIFSVYRHLVSDVDQFLKDSQIGRLHYQLLLCVRRHPNAPVNHYLTDMRLTKQSISRLIRDLLEQGLIEERAGLRDRRERCLALTDKGEELERQLVGKHTRRFARLQEKVGPDAAALLREAMGHLLETASPRRIPARPGRPLDTDEDSQAENRTI